MFRNPILLLLILLAGTAINIIAEEVCSFVGVSDLHVSEKDGAKNFSAFVQQVQEMDPKPDFVVITGDIHTRAFQNLYDKLKPEIPFHVVFGNHERREDRESLKQLFPEDFKENDFYSFVYKNVKCIVLCDAGDNGDHIGHFESEGIKGQEQQAWLEQELSVDRKKYPFVFVFAHIPPGPSGKAETMYLSTNDQKALREIFKKYKPSAMFCGHLHKRHEFTIEDVPVFILPSLNWNFENYPAGFYHVRIEGKVFRATFVPLNISPKSP